MLGQERCDAKENEISAIPRLLERLELRGALVTIDAMGCQHGIADTILGRRADDLLALTSNRKSLHAEVAMSFDQATDLAAHETTDADHGRVETRRAWVSPDVDWLRPDRAEPGIHRFPGLKAIGMIEATVEHKGRTTVARRCFLSSAPLSAAALLHATRAHWGVETRLRLQSWMSSSGKRGFARSKLQKRCFCGRISSRIVFLPVSLSGGRKPLRDALSMPALVAMRFNPDLEAKHTALRAAGKPAKVAIVAFVGKTAPRAVFWPSSLRKLLEAANALVKADRLWVEKAP